MALEFNLDKINKAIDKAIKEAANGLHSYIILEVISKNRPWPEPLGNRDIVDFGQLRASQRISSTSPREYRISWTAEHALYVHTGYTIKSTGKLIPGRPFRDIGIQEYPMEQQFAFYFSKYMR